MKFLFEIVLLASMGFLHFKHADGMFANFAPNRIIITMHDGCTSLGNIIYVLPTQNLPDWIKHNQVTQAPPNDFEFYIPFQHHKHRGTFPPPANIYPHNHSPPNHTPFDVQIHIGFEIPQVRSEFYKAHEFEPYNPGHQQMWYPRGWFPANDYIYVTVPGGQKYRAPLVSLDVDVKEKKFKQALPRNPDEKDDRIPNRNPYYADTSIYNYFD